MDSATIAAQAGVALVLFASAACVAWMIWLAIRNWILDEAEREAPDGFTVQRMEGRGAGYITAHSPESCDGGPCPLHARSDHHMRGWRQNWRDDRGIMERICPCGVGHPDPDCRNAARDSRHGCCGCCETPTRAAFRRMVEG